MLDLRLYRLAFVPLLLGILLAAFGLSDRPRAIGTTLAPDAFDGRNALGVLSELDRTFPNRRPGSPGDDALAERVQDEMQRAGFAPKRYSDRGETIDGDADLTTIIGERTGRDPRRLILVARRDASRSGSTAQLSGTAALVALTRLFRGRSTRRTLTLVSTTGGTGGEAGVRKLLSRIDGPVDAVIVLGDVAGELVRAPRVIPWSEQGGFAPMRLRRTVEEAVREEAGLGPSSPRALVQLARLAVPLTLTPQGALGADGLSAVTLQVSGERGPRPDTPVSQEQLEAFGRATLRSLSALDNGPAVPSGPREYLIFQRRVLASWAVAMLAGLLLLPAAVGAVDGLARVRRRRRPVAVWLRWLAFAALPFLAVVVVARLLGVSGAAPDLEGVLAADAVGVQWGLIAGLVVTLVLGLVARRAAGRPVSVEDHDGATAAVLVALVVLALVVWVVNPYTALLLGFTVHLWLLASVPEVRVRRFAGVTLALAGLAPWVLVGVYYARQFGFSAGEALSSAALLLSGGTVGPLGATLAAGVLGCGLCAAILAWRKTPRSDRSGDVR